MSVRQTLAMTDDQLSELMETFSSIDQDGSGTIDVSELQHALELCGLKIPSYQVRDLIAKYDSKVKDGQIDIEEFKQMYADLKAERDVGITFKKQVQTRKDVETMGGSSQASVEGTTHTVRKEEQKAFADWINRALGDDPDCAKYLPLSSTGEDLYKNTQDGILLCKLINKSVPDTIDERAINKTNLSIYRRAENHNLALMSAQSIGCNIVNIGDDDLEKCKPHLVLGLLWQVIRIGLLSDINLANHPGLINLLEDGETPEDLKKLSPEQILIRWVNYHLRNAGVDRRIRNFQEDIKDSEAYCYLLEQIAPRENGVMSGPPLSEHNLEQRAELMLQEADKIGCRSFVSPKDVTSGNYKLNMAFVANLFNQYPALEPPEDMEMDVVEETREEKTYRNWMNSLGVQPYVHYLYSDLQDGLVYFKLYDIIRPGVVNWKKVIQKFNKLKINFEKLENCNYVVALGKECKFSLVGISGADINEGNPTLTLGLVWQLMRAYTLSILRQLAGGDSLINDAAIIEWANAKLKEGGKKSSFTGFNDSTLSDGRTIIDLIDCIRRGMINYDLVKDGASEEDKMSNAKYAISMARKAGAKVYALPEDIVDVKQKMIMTIFACLMARDMRSQQNGETS